MAGAQSEGLAGERGREFKDGGLEGVAGDHWVEIGHPVDGSEPFREGRGHVGGRGARVEESADGAARQTHFHIDIAVRRARRDRGHPFGGRAEGQPTAGDVNLQPQGANDIHPNQAGDRLPHFLADIGRAHAHQGRRDGKFFAAQAYAPTFVEAPRAASVHQQQALATLEEDVAAG